MLDRMAPAKCIQAKNTRTLQKAILLASTVLLVMPQTVWAQVYDAGNHEITSDTPVSGNLVVGGPDGARLTVRDGAILSNVTGYIGEGENAAGTVTVTGTRSQWLNADQLFVGQLGDGTLNIEAGGAVENTSGYLGYSEGSVGTVIVTGQGATWTNSDALIIGNEGNGQLTIAEGGTVSVGAAQPQVGYDSILSIANQTGSTGTLNIGAAADEDAAAAGTLKAAGVSFGVGTGK